MQDWHDMATAPRDGTDVILKIDTGGFRIVSTRAQDRGIPFDERPAYFCDAYEDWLSNGHWADEDKEFGDDSPDIVRNPIGWKPA